MLSNRDPELAIAVGLQVRECLHHSPDVVIGPGDRRQPTQTVAGRERTPEQNLGMSSVVIRSFTTLYLCTEPHHCGGVSIQTGGTVCLLVDHLCSVSSLQSDVVPIENKRVILLLLQYLGGRRSGKS